MKSYNGIDIEIYRGFWDKYKLNNLIQARINRADAGDVILIYAQHKRNTGY